MTSDAPRAGVLSIEEVEAHAKAFPADEGEPAAGLWLVNDPDRETPQLHRLRVARAGEQVYVYGWCMANVPIVVRRGNVANHEAWLVEPATGGRRYLPCTHEGLPVAMLPLRQRELGALVRAQRLRAAVEALHKVQRTWEEHKNQAELNRRAVDVATEADLLLLAVDMPDPSALTPDEAQARAHEKAKAAKLEPGVFRPDAVVEVQKIPEGTTFPIQLAAIPIGARDPAPDAVSDYIDALCMLRLARRGFFLPARALTEDEAASRAIEACHSAGVSAALVEKTLRTEHDALGAIFFPQPAPDLDDDPEEHEVRDDGALAALCALFAIQHGYAVSPPDGSTR